MKIERRDIPNIISILRIFLSLPVAYLLLQEQFTAALMLFFVAGLSDGLDGYLAKRNRWHSRLGSILDPLADKVMLITAFVALGWIAVIPPWLVAVVIGRDVVIVLGAAAYYRLIGRYDMAPSWISKINTTVQIILVLALVFSLGVWALPQWLLEATVFVTLATTILSGLDYVWTWGQRAYEVRHKHLH